jgi:hypothetical protein
MTRIYLAFDGAVATLRWQKDQWIPQLALKGKDCQCLAADLHSAQRVYCGTFEEGLWHSEDAGTTWQPVAEALPHASVMSVAVSPLEETGGQGLLWAGTEPTALFRSADGGESWYECSALRELPSRHTWSFPPRPWTHHVRWIEPDPHERDRIFVGIELGGVMRSLDNGETWEDRKPNSQHDCHTLRTHPQAPGVLYEAAGGGFAESHDGGESWRRYDEGLRYTYLWGLAADPGDPDTLVVSASPNARAAHNDAHAEALLHRRQGDEPWQPVQSGLPSPAGTRAYSLASHVGEAGAFYAATRQELYKSIDSGLNWERQEVAWPEDAHFTSVNDVVVTDAD